MPSARTKKLQLEVHLAKRQAEPIRQFAPYQKQTDVARATGSAGFVAVFALNQCGKTLTAAEIVAMHATGLYQQWYKDAGGFMMDDIGDMRVISASPKTLKEGAFVKLFGHNGYIGIKGAWQNKDKPWTGLIPRWAIKSIARETNTDRVEHVVIEHASGKELVIDFMHTEKSILDFQSKTGIRYVWIDEGIPLNYFQETIPRQTHSPYGSKGLITMTPHLYCPKDFVDYIYQNPKTTWVGNDMITIGIDDVPDHIIPEERKQELIRNTSEREAPARLYGIPSGGGGSFFTIRPGEIRYPKAQFIRDLAEGAYSVVHGIDFGFGLGDAMAFGSLYTNVHTGEHFADRVVKEHKMAPGEFVNKLRTMGIDVTIPCAWPHDGKRGDKREDKQPFAQSFRDAGLNMLPSNVTRPNREAIKHQVWWAIEEKGRNHQFYIVEGNGGLEDEWSNLRLGEDGTVTGHDHAMDFLYCAYQSRGSGRILRPVDRSAERDDNIIDFPVAQGGGIAKPHLLW